MNHTVSFSNRIAGFSRNKVNGYSHALGVISAFFCIIALLCASAHAHDMRSSSEAMALNGLIHEIADLSAELNPDSLHAANISEITDTMIGHGMEAWSMMPELLMEIRGLSVRDGDISVLEALYDAGESMDFIFDRLSSAPDEHLHFSPDILSLHDSARGHSAARGIRGTQSSPEEDFKETPYSKIKGKIHEKILDLDVDFDLKLLDFNIARDISLGLGYRWGLEPSYEDGFFTRIDSYRLRSRIRIGDIIQSAVGSSLPVYMNLSGDRQIIFARQFKSQLKAATAAPYNPLRLPINSENAMKMDVGDFVSIPASMNIVTGASASFGGGISGSARAYYLLSGDFRVNILKMDEQRVRVRLIGMRRSGTGAAASIDYGFNLFGIRFIDKQIGSFLDTNLFRIRRTDISGENFSVDYIFNLGNQDAADAYNKFLNANLKFRVMPELNPFEDSEDAAERFFNNLAAAENLHIQDRNMKFENRRVTRVFKASNFFDDTASNIKIGFNLIRFVRGRRWIENHLSVFDQYNVMSRYFVPASQAHRENRFLFGLFRSRNTLNTYSLMDTDHDWNVTGVDTFAYTRNAYDKKHYAYQYRKTRNSLFNSLGDLAVTSGLINNLPSSDSAVENFRLSQQVLLGDNTVHQLLERGTINREHFWNAMQTTMLAYKDEIYLWAGGNNDNLENEYWRVNTRDFGPAKLKLFELFRRSRWDIQKWRQLERFETNFYKAVGKRTTKDKVSEYLQLYQSSFARPFLLRFTLEAIKQAQIPLEYTINVHVRGRGLHTYNLNHGNMQLNDRLYREINTIISHITDTSYDMFDIVQQEQQLQ